MQRRRPWTLAAITLGAAFLTGCLELEQTYTLNPDGSGKVALNHLAPGGNPFAPEGAPKPDPKELAKKAIQDQIGKGTGIDAWSDVSAEVEKDGRVRFRGTAYFADISKLRLDGDEGKDAMSFKKDGAGMLLTFKTEGALSAPGAGEAPAPVLTDAQIEEKIKEERANFAQGKQMMVAFLGNLKVKVSFVLPGTVTEANILKQEGNTVTMQLTGQQLIDAAEKVNNDDKLMREKLKSKQAEDEVMTQALFGKKGPAQARVGGDIKPLFDYKAESARAKAAEAAMLDKLGVKRGAAGALPGAT